MYCRPAGPLSQRPPAANLDQLLDWSWVLGHRSFATRHDSCLKQPIMSRQYIYTIERLTKKHGQREVLKDIWLSFYPGAKIGVLGRNGSGKSTLLRIMAGKDKTFEGQA